MKTAAYVVRVPHAQHRAFAVQCTVLDHSLMVWAGAAPRSLGDEDDEEVRAAMQAAGRDEPTHVPARLADDWGVAMNRGGSGNVRVGCMADAGHDRHSTIQGQYIGRHGTADRYVGARLTQPPSSVFRKSFSRWICPTHCSRRAPCRWPRKTHAHCRHSKWACAASVKWPSVARSNVAIALYHVYVARAQPLLDAVSGATQRRPARTAPHRVARHSYPSLACAATWHGRRVPHRPAWTFWTSRRIR